MIARLFLSVAFLVLIASAALPQIGPTDNGRMAPTDLNRIKIGDLAPDFTLEGADGQTITLSDFRGKKSVVLVFYRGYW